MSKKDSPFSDLEENKKEGRRRSIEKMNYWLWFGLLELSKLMNFLNLPNSKENAYFTIIFMEENSQNFNKITTFVPADKKVKHLK